MPCKVHEPIMERMRSITHVLVVVLPISTTVVVTISTKANLPIFQQRWLWVARIERLCGITTCDRGHPTPSTMQCKDYTITNNNHITTTDQHVAVVDTPYVTPALHPRPGPQPSPPPLPPPHPRTRPSIVPASTRLQPCP